MITTQVNISTPRSAELFTYDQDWREVAALVAEGLARRTIDGHLGLLHAVCEDLVALDDLPKNPVAAFYRMVPASAREGRALRAPVILDPAQCRWLLAALRGADSFLAPLATWLICLPVRVSELRGLRWANVDERRMVVAIVEQRTHQDPFDPGPPKTASGIRDLPITAELLELARAAGGADLVFPSKAGTPFNDRTLRKHLNDAIAAHHREHAALTIPDFRVHDFRHTCASNILRLGCSLDYERALLGHAPEHITAHYARPDAEVLRPWIERWSRVVLGLPPPAAARAPDEPLAQ